jgi:hypothetical protein
MGAAVDAQQALVGRPILARRAGQLTLALVLSGAVLLAILFSQRELIRLSAKGYVFGYPLVMMDITRASFIENMAPANQLVHVSSFPDEGFRDVVRANVDTLYSLAWLDLSGEPLVLDMPASERYYVLQLLDGWTNVLASLGPRTSGSAAGHFVLVGPTWQGQVPANLTLLRAATSMVWLLGRIQTNGEADYANVQKIQQQMHLTPLSQWQAGKRSLASVAKAPAQKPRPPLLQIRALDASAFFTRLQRLLHDNPAPAQDSKALADLAQLGVHQGQSMLIWSVWQAKLAGLGMWLAERQLQQALDSPQGLNTGWRQPPISIGKYAQDYGLRAVVAMIGLGANLAADAVYPNARQDSLGQPLQGGQHYRLHFAVGQLPPVQAFWSLTAYDEDGFLIANPLRRYAIGDRDPLHFNADGSLDIILQSTAPAASDNWLPIPASGAFSITGRLYWPKAEVLNGHWRMPGIQPVAR